jgi:sugar O-acyltransferase (sialic acid O-acetyltransferase NeuD family)
MRDTDFLVVGYSQNFLPLVIDSFERGRTQVRLQVLNQEMHLINLGSYSLPNVKITTFDRATLGPVELALICGFYKVDSKLKLLSWMNSENLSSKSGWYNLIDPQAVLSSSVLLGKGVFVGPCSVIGPETRLGDFVSINRGVSIGHHSSVGNFCTLNPGANVAGRVVLGDRVTLGIGVNVVDGVTIGSGCFVGAGSCVTKDLPANSFAFGSPAKVLRKIS